MTPPLRHCLPPLLLLLTTRFWAQSVRVVITTADLTQMLAPQPELRFSNDVTITDLVIEVA